MMTIHSPTPKATAPVPTVNAAVRLRSLVLGIRPSLVHAYGITPGAPADNLTEPGIETWRSSLEILARELDQANGHSLGPRDGWIRQWIPTELERDQNRWTDASSMLRLLALALGTDSAGPDGSVGRTFWMQWQRNLANLHDLLMFRAAAASADTAELVAHCRELAERDLAPGAVVALLDEVATAVANPASTTEPDDGSVFRPLATEIDRIYLSDIVAVSFANADTCLATQTRFYNPGADTRRSCTATRSERKLQAVGPRFRLAS